ncbi:gasdermin-B isoform X4 [Eulemur rufifrons]|uniref:gasdermin-B isoform X4 n=1 Tax=Eulemur rufifrons TaxID=859984 RepID=UPI0037448F71
MPSVFEECTRAVVQKMDPGGDMIPVRSLFDADRFHCFYLVREKRGFFGSRYCRTDLTLMDILERKEGEVLCDELDSGLQDQKAEFQILDTVDSKGKLTVKLPKEITITGELQGSHEHKMKILKNQISQQYLDTLVNRKLKKKLPPSFQSIRARRENLYLVTETLKTAKEETLKSQRWYRFWSQIYLGDLNYERKHPREETIPPNWVLGYRIKQLIFPNEEEMRRSLNSEGSRNMKEKVQAMVISLQDLTEEERRDVLSSLTKCLSDDEYLEDLEQRVFEALISGELQMEGSSGPLLSSLFNIAGVLIEARAETILDFLDALIELSEKQLVAECLEKGTLPLLKDQVESMLEQVWDKQASNPHDVSCDLEARTLCALYATVSILLQLSSEPTSASS